MFTANYSSGFSVDCAMSEYFAGEPDICKATTWSIHFTTMNTTFIRALKSCVKSRDLKTGLQIHVRVISAGLFEVDPFLGGALVDMYAKCGSLSRAQQTFNKLPLQDRVSWTALMSGYVKHGDGKQALKCFEQMQLQGIFPDSMAFVCALKACGSLRDLETGQHIHDELKRNGFLERNAFLGSTLIDMYADCGCLGNAQQVFDEFTERDVVLWNALITGYNKVGHGEEALQHFEKMKLEGPPPDAITLVCSLKACGSIGAIDKGEAIHAEIERTNLLETDPVVRSTLIDMYSKCDNLEKAHETLKNLPTRDVFSWTVLISAYTDCACGAAALECYEQMKVEGVAPSSVTYICILKACTSLGAKRKGQLIHAEIENNSISDGDDVIYNAVVDMYGKFGLLLKAKEVVERMPTRNVISWNALISGYVEHGLCENALICYDKMQLECVVPDAVTYMCCLKACGNRGAIGRGLEIHMEIERKGFIESDYFVRSTLIDMYAKCGLLHKAQEIFDRIRVQDVVSWNALITGYVEHECGEEALLCLDHMQLEHVVPNAVTYLCCLKACVIVGALNKGREIHAKIARMGLLEKDMLIGNTLVDMYAKGGSLEMAEQVIDQLPARDVVSWNALMTGYVQVGKIEPVFGIFEKMLREGIRPDPITFIIALTACTRSGLSNKSQSFFETMSDIYGIVPTVKHHTCMIDLLGRLGQLEKAITMIKNLPVSPNLALWHAILYACNNWGNVKLGKEAFEHAVG